MVEKAYYIRPTCVHLKRRGEWWQAKTNFRTPVDHGIEDAVNHGALHS
jgi:hypothetical protein